MTVVCPSCGQETPEGFPRCANCGAELALDSRPGREERKVVTCLFCDLVGFTSRAERLDPEDVRRLLRPYHERVRGELERFGGTVEKFIGDAVMAVFGAPITHEDDPERAVRAALAIRDWADEEGVELRIGINSGEALVTIGGEPLAAGDVVNTAARLQAAAASGGILVGEVTYRTTRNAIEYADQAPVSAKGKAEPVPVWRALQARARVKVERAAQTPLVGRRRELSLLRETLDRVQSEREPQLMSVIGVPGMGKSRLVYELFMTIEERPELVYWRHGRSLPYGEGVTFWALSEIVKAHAGILETDDREEAESKLRAAVDALPGVEDPRWLERHLRPLVGLETSGLAENRRTEAFAAWRQFLESLAEQRPVVVVFEDLHWADDALLDFIDHLVDWARGVPLLVLGTARPELLERRRGWGGGKPNATTLSLQPLAEEETAQLVHALLESPVLPAGTQSELVARAGGNPLYAEEFARLVAEGRAPDELPETVQGLIAARLDGLSDEEKSVLQAGAVVGRTFWLGSISAVAAAPRWTAEELLHALERKDFVRRERRSSVAGEVEFAFRHVLIRDVAYAGIPRVDRVDRHRRTAEWIESLGRPEDHAELLAEHYLSVLDIARTTDQDVSAITGRACDVLIEAGDRASALSSFPASVRFYDHALELIAADAPQRADVLLRLGRALHYAVDARAEEVLGDATRGLAAAGATESAAAAQILLSQLWWDRGKRDLSSKHLDEARALVGAEPSAIRAQVLAAQARMHSNASEPDHAIPLATEALAIADKFGLDEVRAHALTTLGASRFDLGDAAGIPDMERAFDVAQAAGSHLAANALNNLAFMYTLLGDVRRDRQLREEAMDVAERFGDVRMLTFTRFCLPSLDYYAGQWERALSEVDRAVTEFEEGSPHYLEPNLRATRAAILLAQARDAAAAADAARAVEAARETKDSQMIFPAVAVLLRLQLETGQVDRASELAAELLADQPRHTDFPPAVELAWAVSSGVATAEDLRAWIGQIAYASRWSDAALAILDDDLERAAGTFDEIGALPDEARARLRIGNPENIRRALDFYRSVGATRYIGEGEALLAVAS